MEDIKNLTDEELYALIVDKYGPDWHLRELPDGDPLIVEFFKRIAQAG